MDLVSRLSVAILTLLESIAFAVNHQWPSRREIFPNFWYSSAVEKVGGAGLWPYPGIRGVGYVNTSSYIVGV